MLGGLPPAQALGYGRARTRARRVRSTKPIGIRLMRSHGSFWSCDLTLCPFSRLGNHEQDITVQLTVPLPGRGQGLDEVLPKGIWLSREIESTFCSA